MSVSIFRIWKGLFYCYWMSDKPLVQEELAENIASMIGNKKDQTV
jgi:ribosomal RNA-processing protein 1